MKGYWHIPALSAAAAAVSVILDINFSLFIFLWLLYLYFDHRIRMLPVFLAIISFFLFYQHIPQLETEQKPPSEQLEYFGKIVNKPIINQIQFEIIIEDQHSNERYMVLYFPNEEMPVLNLTDQLKYGANCEVTGNAELPPAARNPGQFDYRHYLLNQNINYQIIINDLN